MPDTAAHGNQTIQNVHSKIRWIFKWVRKMQWDLLNAAAEIVQMFRVHWTVAFLWLKKIPNDKMKKRTLWRTAKELNVQKQLRWTPCFRLFHPWLKTSWVKDRPLLKVSYYKEKPPNQNEKKSSWTEHLVLDRGSFWHGTSASCSQK